MSNTAHKLNTLLVFSATNVVSYLKHSVASMSPAYRPVSDVHIKTSVKDIIKNDIKSVLGFNRVDLSYIDEDVKGMVANTFAMGSLADIFGVGKSIRLDNIDNPESRTNLNATLSQTIESTSIRTYATFQKNAAIRGRVMVDFPQIVANNVLANLVKDYYDGELILLFDPSIKPFDVIFIHDSVNDMWGMIQVKEVTHSISPMTGAVTVVKPDMYTRTSTEMKKSPEGQWQRLVDHTIFPLLFLGLSVAIGRGAGMFFSKIATGIPFVRKIIQRFAKYNVMRQLNLADDQLEKEVSKNIVKLMKTPKALAKASKIYNVNMTDNFTDAGNDLMQKFITNIKTSARRSKDNFVKQLDNNLNIDSDDITAVFKKAKKIQTESIGKDDFDEDAFAEAFSNAIYNNSSIVSKELRRNSVDSIINFAMPKFNKLFTIRGIFGIQNLKGLLYTALYKKIGSVVLPDFTPFIAQLGEFYNQNPIIMAGLIQKGEPMVSGVDGMSRKQFGGISDWISYKFQEAFNPLFTLAGDVEELMYNTNESINRFSYF